MMRAIVEDLVESMRDTLAYILFTLFVAWLYAPEGLLA